MSKYGITETKEMLTLGLQLGLAGKMAFDDKKLTAADFGLVATVFPVIGPAISGATDIPKELSDLDGSESQELLLHAAQYVPQFAGNSKKLGNIIVASLKLALAVGELVSEIVKNEESSEDAEPVVDTNEGNETE